MEWRISLIPEDQTKTPSQANEQELMKNNERYQTTKRILSVVCCPARIRTLSNRTKTCCATITPRDNRNRKITPYLLHPSAKVIRKRGPTKYFAVKTINSLE